jgi:hypothetical protein
MSNQSVIPFDPSKLAASLKQVTREVAPTGSFLKMGKDGEWVYGIEQDTVPESAEFMVNPAGFVHGYVVWHEKNAEKLFESCLPVTDALPENGPLPAGGKGFEFQLGLHLKGVSGKTKDTDMLFRTSSVGGKRAVAGLASLVSDKLMNGDGKIVPVVTLNTDNYTHKQYGKIYVPMFDIVRWIAMPAPAAPAAEKRQAVTKKSGKR